MQKVLVGTAWITLQTIATLFCPIDHAEGEGGNSIDYHTEEMPFLVHLNRIMQKMIVGRALISIHRRYCPL
jgi:hypothetical protein